MKTWQIISYSSIIIWAIIPFFYRSNKHFYFFVLLALTDISSYFLNLVFLVSSQILWIPFSYLTIFSLNRDFFSKYKIQIIVGFFLAIIAGIYSSNIFQMYFVLATQIILFLLFTRFFISIFLNENKINSFYLVMIFYMALSVFKIIAFLRELSSGLNIFYATIMMQILIGLFLIYHSAKKGNLKKSSESILEN